MHFAVQRDVLARVLKDVSSALASRVVQPILNNVLIESVGDTTMRFQATDLDLAIEGRVSAVVYAPGAITLPGKKLVEIVSKLANELVSFQVNKETLETSLHCQRSKFSLVGLPADDFPRISTERTGEGVLMPADVLRKAISQTSFAAAGYDVSSILGGVYLLINDGIFECTATDGSRLAHRREQLNVMVAGSKRSDSSKEGENKAATATMDKPHTLKAIVPGRACGEIVKLIDGREASSKGAIKQGNGTGADNSDVRMAVANGQITFETETHYLSSRLIAGEYPRYQELFPTEFKYLARFNKEEFSSAIDRVAVMSDDRTHLVKLHFENDALQVTSNTPDVGRAQEEVKMKFEGQVLDVAVNVRYMADVLQKLSCEEIELEMNGSLKPIIMKAIGDENYKYLLMPVQAK
jgi:DNA polymerase-3 subunit beta